MRDMILLILISVLFGNSVLEARVGASATGASLPQETTQKATVQERIMEIPPGTMVEVRLMNKHTLRGRLGEVTNEGFSLQTAQGNKVETQKIAFTEVKSLKKVEGETTGKKVGRGVIYGLAGIGVLILIMTIVLLARQGRLASAAAGVRVAVLLRLRGAGVATGASLGAIGGLVVPSGELARRLPRAVSAYCKGRVRKRSLFGRHGTEPVP